MTFDTFNKLSGFLSLTLTRDAKNISERLHVKVAPSGSTVEAADLALSVLRPEERELSEEEMGPWSWHKTALC